MHKYYDENNCNRLMKLVSIALDGGMTPAEEQHFLEEISKCNYCLSRFEIEKSFKQFLQTKVDKKPVSQNCIDSIKAKINGQTG
jgi:hypothetical protein